jgi:ribosome modulation factor
MRMSLGTKEQRDRLEREHTREYMDILAIFRKAKVSLA